MKKTLSIFVSVGALLGFVFTVAQANVTQAQTVTPIAPVFCYNWNTNLGMGRSGPDIRALGKALLIEGVTNEDGIYSSFDEKMASAVVGFQQKYASEILTPYRFVNGTGYVGPSTRAKLNQLYGCAGGRPIVTPIVETGIVVPFQCPTGYTPPRGWRCPGTITPVPTIVPQVSTPSIIETISSVTGNAFLASASEDKVWKLVDPDNHMTDWKWSISLNNTETINKTIKKMVLVHNTGGEGWSTDDLSDNPVGKSLYLLATCDATQSSCQLLNSYVSNMNMSLPANSKKVLFAYGYPGSMRFTGGTLVVSFTDNTVAKISIPSSSLTPTYTAWTNTTLTNACELNATVTNTNLAENNTSWGFDVVVKAINQSTPSKGWTTNFEGYVPEITPYGSTKHYGNFYISSGPLKFNPFDSVDKNCSGGITVNPPAVTKPSITVTSPNGGEIFQKGTTQTVKWLNVDRGSLFEIGLRPYPDNEPSYVIVDEVKASRDGSYQWVIGKVTRTGINRGIVDIPEGKYRLFVGQSGGGTKDSDVSDFYFTITAPISTIPKPTLTVDQSSVLTGQYANFAMSVSSANYDKMRFLMTCPTGIAGYSALDQDDCNKNVDLNASVIQRTIKFTNTTTEKKLVTVKLWPINKEPYTNLLADGATASVWIESGATASINPTIQTSNVWRAISDWFGR